jgi:hypothetical protein
MTDVSPRRRVGLWPVWVIAPVASAVLFVSAIQMAITLGQGSRLPAPLLLVVDWTSSFRTVNRYGLFAVMTTSRPEIVLEGSDDGRVWRPYELRWKPGEVTRRPRFVAPHQPRLDWQMWFAALGRVGENPWLVGLARRLLEGSPEVLRLFAGNPFPNHPPRYVRATLYDYRFTTPAERREGGAWWRRRELGVYLPVVWREMLAGGERTP